MSVNRRKRRKGRRRPAPRGASSWLSYVVGLLLICIASAIGVFAFTKYLDLKDDHVALDKSTYCPTDSANLTKFTALLVDTTDRLSEIQQSSIVNVVDRVISQIPRYGALAIFTVSTDPEVQSQPLLMRCNPGRKSEIDPLIGNPEKIEKEWEDGFKNAVSDELKRSLEADSADSSPILESIQRISIQQFDKIEYDLVARSLVVVSDFLQHTSDYSHYRSVPNYSDFESTQYFRKIKVNLQSVDVEMWQVRRNSSRQNERLREFWEDYFRACGVATISFNQLSG